MSKRHAPLPPDQHDANLLHWLYFVQQVGLVLVAQIALIGLAASLYPALHLWLPDSLIGMGPFSAINTLLCAASLFCLETERSARTRTAGRGLALVTAILASLTLLARLLFPTSAFSYVLAANPARTDLIPSLLVSPTAFLLLGMAIFFLKANHTATSRLADILSATLAVLTTALFYASFFAAVNLPGSSAQHLVSTPTLVSLVLLTTVTLLRRAEHGIFGVFLGVGLGSKLSRMLAPILFILPLLREVGRAHLTSAQVLPAQYSVAILTSAASLIGFSLLIWLVRRINRMQTEIQYLTLRDELTGLYNVRGFNLLAEQALRLARRGRYRFGVLYIDLDNLKQINDRLGHDTGSDALVETGELLTDVFRESDVIGRVGGDEFIVAGQFSHQTIESAITRLHRAAEMRNVESGRKFNLSFSTGYAIADGGPVQTLKNLVNDADEAMYEMKRQRKKAIA